MAYPKELRYQLGVSARAFADIIQCNYGQLTMAEAGKRSLPVASLIICRAIEQWLNGNPNVEAVNNQWSPQLDKYVKSRTVLLNSLLQKASNLQEELTKAQRLQAFSQGFAATPATPTDEIGQLQLQILQRRSAKKVQQLGRENLRLQILISGLKAELAEAAQFKKLLPNL